MKKNKGFTLIELLVVVIIMGILAAIIFAAISDARKKGADAGIQSNMEGIRKQAEIFYATNSNRYSPGLPFTGSCPYVYSAIGPSMYHRDQNIFDAIAQSVNLSGVTGTLANKYAIGTRCFSTTTSYAVAVVLRTGNSSDDGWKSWCVDNSGNSGVVNAAAGAAYTVSGSTATCNL